MVEIQRIEHIVKCPTDSRKYRGLKLQNDLRVMLISDPSTDTCAAALEVGAGFMNDPDNIPGLAHFMEHMLFAGTEKYPAQNDFLMYLLESGGFANASTYYHWTRYHFDIPPSKFEGALDRLAQFFIAPLFSQSGVESEINAINSEHEGRMFNNVSRNTAVFADVMDPEHPYSHFGCGNKITLEENPKKMGIDVHKELLKFYEKWYSSNIMTLAVLGRESLDKLEEMVIEKFSKIKNKNIIQPNWSKKIFRDGDNGIKILITPIMDYKVLSINFLTSDIHMHYKSSPHTYVEELIDYKGKNSIMSELRERGWAVSLNSDFEVFPRGFSIYKIVVALTEDGFNNINGIVTLVFQYIELLRTEEPKKWIFDDERTLRETSLRFQTKQPPFYVVSSIVHNLQFYPFEDILTLNIPTEWRPDLIKDLLNEIVPSNCWLTIIAKELEPLSTKIEPWHKVKYGTEKISSETLKSWENCGLNKKFKIPPPNQFIPTDFELINKELENDKSDPEQPKIIYDTPLIRIWYKHDIEFLEPRMYTDLSFANPQKNFDLLHEVMRILFTWLINDDIKENYDDITRAGFLVELHADLYGIGLTIGGYSHKQEIIVENVLNNFLNFTINKRIFENTKNVLIQNLENKKTVTSSMYAWNNLNSLLTESQWTDEEYLEVMPLITFERIQTFMLDFLTRIHVEGLICGNVNKSKALEIIKLVEKTLEGKISCPVLSSTMFLKREHKLCSGDNYLYELCTKFQRNSCTLIYFQCEYNTDTTTVHTELIKTILREPLYNFLRTKEHLGYGPQVAGRIKSGSTGLLISLESTKHPAFIEERIEIFLKNILNRIKSMSDEEFQGHKDAALVFMRRPHKELSTKWKAYIREIFSGEYNFNRQSNEVAILENLEKEEFINYFKTNFFTSRRTLSIHVMSIWDEFGKNEFDYRQVHAIEKIQESKEKICDIDIFKASRGFYPLPKSFLQAKFKGIEHTF